VAKPRPGTLRLAVVQIRNILVAVTLLTPAAVAQETRTVTGTATYRERMALPQDAVFEATLEDVSRAGAPATVIGRTRRRNPGGPPFRFSIRYDPRRIEAGHTYSVRARITAGDNLLFTTDQAHLVLTGGRGNQAGTLLMRRAGGQVGQNVAERAEVERKTGMFLYMADAPGFTDCRTGERWPVAMEGEYKALERAFLDAPRQPGEALLAEVEGRVVARPNPDTGQPTATLVVERFIALRPGEACGAARAGTPLEGTNWKLSWIDGRPIVPGETERAPNLVFQATENRVTGFGGCNNFTGSYERNGNEVNIGRVAATLMACAEGMETEGAFFKSLEKVRGWKIMGQQLELYDAGGNLVARFEAQALP
jgi:uncharacterized lipoprotein YbaY/heat shock protein HslJ